MPTFSDFFKAAKVRLVSLTQTAAGSSITRISLSYSFLVKLSLLTLITTVLGWTVTIDFFSLNLKNFNIALAQASVQRFLQMDENGDYYIVNSAGNPLPREWDNRSFLPYEFKVGDNDPNGLNCRYFDTMIHDGSDIYNYPVVDKFYEGDLIKSLGIVLDDQGLPWVIVTNSSNKTCFIRANSKYLRAVRPI